ncbi:DUF1254 domain-containing protein [Nocardia yamanashiensis]|uniref:DUF1254 domain-containing protein n=1 Tax=Nocardia yamanashiensis TaxID=209247 RepID=UPI001E41BA5B|nr:DUF1254 domain-containing protein [Nocardia yamanashiensis]UGT44989.1 DUF1254 domain-containing protein [Nocardia yamanashiensis]
MRFGQNLDEGISRRAVFGLGMAAAAAFGLSACGDSGDSSSATTSTTPPSNDPKDIAIDAYVFGYPLVLTDVTRETGGPANQFVHQNPPTPQEKQVVRLNLDTLYSQAWLDLRAEPMVLQVPAIESGRYWLMQLLDAWTNTVHDPSSMDQQIKPGKSDPPYTYLITGPDWSGSVPGGMTQLAMPTGTTWLLGRIEYKGTADLANVRAIQRQLKLAPLSVWSADPNAVQGGPGAQAAGGPSPAYTVAAMDGPTFFDRLCAVMALNPPAAADAPAMKRFATIGVKPGATIDPLSADLLTTAATTARKQIPAYHDPDGQDQNGWVFDLNVGTYGTDYPLRAEVAMLGLGANLPKDAVYPTVNANADGGKRFRLTFPKGELPPVGAFWSLTAYDAHSYLIDNPAGIYSVGHLTPAVAGSDGSVEIAIQSEDPGSSVPTGNWLPIPASGPFSVTLRLYAPKASVLEGKWRVPKLETVG